MDGWLQSIISLQPQTFTFALDSAAPETVFMDESPTTLGLFGIC